MPSFRTIDGARYDGTLIDLAEELVQDHSDGRLSYQDAKKMIATLEDQSGRMTQIERATLAYLIDENYCTHGAQKYFEEHMPPPPEPDTPECAAAKAHFTEAWMAHWKADYAAYLADRDFDVKFMIDQQQADDSQAPDRVQRAFRYYSENVENEDFGWVRLFRHPTYWAVLTTTDGDDGWIELYTPEGETLTGGRSWLELIHWDERDVLRGQTKTGDLPDELVDREADTIWQE
ncbi:MAG: hypothetical protein AAF741_18140 [Bacteroidota bacterium]